MRQDPLYRIVFSLSKTEKREFIRNHSVSGKVKGFLVLFNAINTTQEINWEKLGASFNTEREYYEARRTLKKELEVLLMGNSSRNDQTILDQIKLAKEYLYRNLLDLADSTIQKGKSLAYKLEAFEELGVLLQTEKEIPGRMDSAAFQTELYSCQDEKAKIDQIDRLWLIKKFGVAEKLNPDPKIRIVGSVLKEALAILENPPTSAKGKMRLFLLLRKLYYLNGDNRNAVKYSQFGIDFLREVISEGRKEYQALLIEEYSILAHLFLDQNDRETFLKTLSYIRFFESDTPTLEAQKYQKHTLPLLIFHLDHGYLDLAKENASRLADFLKKGSGYLSPKEMIICHFFLIKFYFWSEEHQLLASSLVEFFHLKKGARKQYLRLFPYGQSLEIFSLINREEFDLARGRLGVLKRFLSKKNISHPYFTALISCAEILIKTPSKQAVETLEKKCDELTLHRFATDWESHFDFFDPIPFLNSQLRNLPLPSSFSDWRKRPTSSKTQTG